MANLTKEQRQKKEQNEADQKIIDDNPGRDAYELLQLGISQEKYSELMAIATAPKEKAKQNVTIPEKGIHQAVNERIAPQKVIVRAQPQTRTFQPTNDSDMAWYIDPNGKSTHMSRKAAERIHRKTPGSKLA